MSARAVLFFAAAYAVALGADEGRRDPIDYEHLRYSVVRIQAVASDFDWSAPFAGAGGGVGLGTGWVVDMKPEPLFVTNAHVVSNAHDVSLQLLVHSSKKWEAHVVSICPTFDLALLTLKEKDSFMDELAAKDMRLRPLELSSGAATMGHPVVALGFPLGMDSLKISAGVVAGNEEVQGNVCIQSTAPISPGSSGGPLLNEDGTKVVGVNFAKSADSSAENINYVIPAWRVKSLVSTYKARMAESTGLLNEPQRHMIRVPSSNAVTVEANGALRKMQNCSTGLFISSLSPSSFFAHADPPVPAHSFLTKVKGRPIDEFGMGMEEDYCADRVKYTDLFFMQDDLEGLVEVEACQNGVISTHQVSLAWQEAYETGIQYVEEPSFETKLTEYEMFGEISIMQMTMNHIELFYRGNPELAGFLRSDLSGENWLIVNYVEPGSYASEIIRPGSVVRKLNGHDVHTLQDFRDHFLPDDLQKMVQADAEPAAATAKADAKADAKKDATEPAKPAKVDAAEPEVEPAAAKADDAEPEVEPVAAKADAAGPAIETAAAKVEAEVRRVTNLSHQVVTAAAASDDAAAENATASVDTEAATTDDESEDEDDDDDDADSEDDDEAGDVAFLAKRASKRRVREIPVPPAPARRSVPVDTRDLVWTLETDDGAMFAVFFEDTLRGQLTQAEAAQSVSLLSPAVLTAARSMPMPSTPFVRSMLERSDPSPQPRAMIAGESRAASGADRVVADIPVLTRETWRPTVQRGARIELA